MKENLAEGEYRQGHDWSSDELKKWTSIYPDCSGGTHKKGDFWSCIEFMIPYKSKKEETKNLIGYKVDKGKPGKEAPYMF
jgi:hypothetical protein